MRKSGWMREIPKVSMSLGPMAQASSATCQPFSCASRIHWYEYLAPEIMDWRGKIISPLFFANRMILFLIAASMAVSTPGAL
ncbi:unnamed protein product [Spirodela intermedia]|uniref:Uncharacterized protein n=2 Tax=Spirodela intermedia TaxID=51605 RepID=A0A7I8IZH3_SPIIN|nr:unnamed protein product [Spirodela intermedia]CAA6663374.1 unnamed protein product [Spirodela intermedia]CAA7399836.1 unnamed protein product [Spirodela intermedia]